MRVRRLFRPPGSPLSVLAFPMTDAVAQRDVRLSFPPLVTTCHCHQPLCQAAGGNDAPRSGKHVATPPPREPPHWDPLFRHKLRGCGFSPGLYVTQGGPAPAHRPGERRLEVPWAPPHTGLGAPPATYLVLGRCPPCTKTWRCPARSSRAYRLDFLQKLQAGVLRGAFIAGSHLPGNEKVQVPPWGGLGCPGDHDCQEGANAKDRGTPGRDQDRAAQVSSARLGSGANRGGQWCRPAPGPYNLTWFIIKL